MADYGLIGLGLIMVALGGMIALWFARRKVKKIKKEMYNHLEDIQVPPGESNKLIVKLQNDKMKGGKKNETIQKKGFFRWGRKSTTASTTTIGSTNVPTITNAPTTSTTNRGTGVQNVERKDSSVGTRVGFEQSAKSNIGYGEQFIQAREDASQYNKLQISSSEQPTSSTSRTKRKIKLY